MLQRLDLDEDGEELQRLSARKKEEKKKEFVAVQSQAPAGIQPG